MPKPLFVAMKTKKKSLSFCCSESFDSMTNIGIDMKFCFQCNENVKDYTKSKNIINETGCGRYNLSQLDYIRRIHKTSIYSKPITLLAFLGLAVTDIKAEIPNEIYNQSNIIDQNKTTSIEGKIIDNKTGKNLAHVEVTATINKKVIYSTTSDSNGNFKLEIDTKKHNITAIFIHFDFVGFKSNTINYKPLPEDLKIKMEAKIPEIEEVVICATGRTASLESLTHKEIDSLMNSIEWIDENEDIVEEDE